jgi:hypothetical protein
MHFMFHIRCISIHKLLYFIITGIIIININISTSSSAMSVPYNSRTDFSKSKIHLRKGHEGPEGKVRYSCTLSLTSALDKEG